MSHILRTFNTWLEERDLDESTKILVVPLEDIEVVPKTDWAPGDQVEVTITVKSSK